MTIDYKRLREVAQAALAAHTTPDWGREHAAALPGLLERIERLEEVAALARTLCSNARSYEGLYANWEAVLRDDLLALHASVKEPK